ncbi:pentatricopeptide repeat-containing protein, partial [Striga asiatica]
CSFLFRAQIKGKIVKFRHRTRRRHSTMTAATLRSHRPLLHRLDQSLSIVPHITSILQSLDPQNPKTHQNPDPSILNQFSPHLNPDLVIDVVKSQTSPYHALFFFTWASGPAALPNSYRLPHFCYIAITDKLLSHKLFSLAADLLKTHDRFSDFMVGVLVKAQKVGTAWGYFGQVVIKTGLVKPDVSTYTTMIRGFCQTGMIWDAEKLFDELPVVKNSIAYNVMLDGLCKKGLVEKARKLLDRMAQDESCSPNTISYTTLIDGYFKRREFENALNCFNEMVSVVNCEPNVLTYNALINGLCLNGLVDEAKKTMCKMRLGGLRESIAAHTSLLKGYCIANRSREAIQHFREMLDLGMILDEKSYTVIVKEYCKLGRVDEAVEILREMRAKGIKPGTASLNAILKSYVRFRDFEKAIDFLRRMACPNFVSYSEVIIGLVRAGGSMKDVDMVVGQMARNGYGLDTTLYGLLIEGYCGEGDMVKAISVFEEMVGKGFVVGKGCLEVLVKELRSRGLLSEVESVIGLLRSSCGACDVEAYESVLN